MFFMRSLHAFLLFFPPDLIDIHTTNTPRSHAKRKHIYTHEHTHTHAHVERPAKRASGAPCPVLSICLRIRKLTENHYENMHIYTYIYDIHT